MKHKTVLGRLQAKIDKCNNKRGCDSYCSKANQAMCDKLRKHSEQISYLREQEIPVERW